MAVTPERMTLAEFLALPEVKPARELRHGVVSQKVPPSGEHSSTQSWFSSQVYVYGELEHLAQAFTEARIVLGTETYVPGVIVYVWDRIPEEDASGKLPFFFTAPPDLAVEIVSPGQTVGSLLDRCREMVELGVRVAILVDPVRQRVHVLRAGAEVGPLRGSDVVDVSDVIPGLHLTAATILAGGRSARRRG